MLLRSKDNLCLLALFLNPGLQCQLLKGKVGIGGKRTLWVTCQNSQDMKSHVRCNHIAVLTDGQVKRSFLDLWLKQIASRHPSQITACKRVCPQCQFIKIGSAVQLR